MLCRTGPRIGWFVALSLWFGACDSDSGGAGGDTARPADAAGDLAAGDVVRGDAATDAAAELPVDPATCNPRLGAAEACGGDLVGTWYGGTICSTIEPFAALAAECPGLAWAGTHLHVAGSLTFAADGSYTRALEQEATQAVTVPAECVTAQGDCLAFQAYAQPLVAYPLTCEVSPACECTARYTFNRDDGGTYAVTGGILALTTPTGAEDYHFCITGDGLQARMYGPGPDAGEFTQTFYRAPSE